MIYSRNFLISAYVWRFTRYGIPHEKLAHLKQLAEQFYDKVGKNKFRTYASLDAATLREFIGE